MSAPAADSLTLVVLAAGLGSRYGGAKQLDAVGSGGATLLDYAVFDAWRAGFRRAVFVIRPDMEESFQAFAEHRFGDRLTVATVHQRLHDVPASATVPQTRAKPWGTGQAVLAAEPRVDRPFAVANADDFYGLGAFEAMAAFLRSDAGGSPPAYAVVGYRLRDTLSPSGGVNRAVCRTAAGGWLVTMEEVLDIAVESGGTIGGHGGPGARRLSGDELVSMNLWGFTPEVFPTLRADFAAFLGVEPPAKAEFLLPTALEAAARRGDARIRVLEARGPWWGVTYAEDRPRVIEALRRLVAQGAYPERLWE